MDSSYRNRLEYPKPGNFQVPLERSRLLQPVNPVTAGSLWKGLKWTSNAFSTYNFGNPPDNNFFTKAANGQLLVTATFDTPSNTTRSIVCGVDLESHPFQLLENYYRGANFIYDVAGTPQCVQITGSEFMGNGLTRFKLEAGLTGMILPSKVVHVTDPTDLTIDPPAIFVPRGNNAIDSYAHRFIIFNDTRNEWRPIDDYDHVTKILTPYTGPANYKGQTTCPTTFGSTLAAGWTNKDMYSIRYCSPFYMAPIALAGVDTNAKLWFEPGQCQSTTSFNLGKNVTISVNAVGTHSYLELTPDPTLSSINYVFEAASGSTTTAVLKTTDLPKVRSATMDVELKQDDFFKGQTIRFDVPCVNMEIIGQVRTITAYDNATGTITFDELDLAVSTNDQFSIHLVANATVTSGGMLSFNNNGYYENEPLRQSNQITKFVNVNGTLINAGTAGETFLTLDRSSSENEYKNLWISWTATDGVLATEYIYTRLITSSTSTSPNQTTVNFKRPLGSSLITATTSAAAGITFIPGTLYVVAAGLATTNDGDGVGLTVNIDAVGGGGEVTLFTIVDPGYYYKVGDTVTITGGGGDCTFTFTAAVLQNLAITTWYICSGICSKGFNTPMNTQRFWVQTYEFDSAANFSPAAGAAASQQQEVCYKVELISLILPNVPICGSLGGLPVEYPYFYVGLKGVGTSGGSQWYIIQSNNPNSVDCQFVCDVDDTSDPLASCFLKIDSNGMTPTIKFNKFANLELLVKTPDGTIFQTCEPDTLPPSAPNPLANLSATFALTRVA